MLSTVNGMRKEEDCMAKKERSLPTPPHRPFGRGKKFESEKEKTELTADRIALAAAEGKLDEFLKKEIPDNEYARNLVSMMMGMTGMMPGASESVQGGQASKEAQNAEAVEVPEDIRKSIAGGDVQGLMEMLRREHQKRNPEAEAAAAKPETPTSETVQSQDAPAIDQELIDALVRIAQDNSVSLDWVIFRAIKVYVLEYKKSGKL